MQMRGWLLKKIVTFRYPCFDFQTDMDWTEHTQIHKKKKKKWQFDVVQPKSVYHSFFSYSIEKFKKQNKKKTDLLFRYSFMNLTPKK